MEQAQRRLKITSEYHGFQRVYSASVLNGLCEGKDEIIVRDLSREGFFLEVIQRELKSNPDATYSLARGECNFVSEEVHWRVSCAMAQHNRTVIWKRRAKKLVERVEYLGKNSVEIR